jgi:hypothetical protein
LSNFHNTISTNQTEQYEFAPDLLKMSGNDPNSQSNKMVKPSPSHGPRGLRVAASEALEHRKAPTSATSIAASYGLTALATVVFDIDTGQRLDALYPADADLSDDARKSVAHLSLPHSNKQDEGDTQFIVRFKKAKDRWATASRVAL